MHGKHLSEFAKNDFDEATANKWGKPFGFLHVSNSPGLRKVHCLIRIQVNFNSKENTLIAIDFGCIKEVPDGIYYPYFELARTEVFRMNIISWSNCTI